MDGKESDMETILLGLIVVMALIAFDWAALTWGVDSRDPLTDDHRR
jgi:hypothetical protein